MSPAGNYIIIFPVDIFILIVHIVTARRLIIFILRYFIAIRTG